MLEAGLPAVCMETRHMKAVLQDQQVEKSDRKDASGIAQMMRVGLYRAANVKTLASQQEQMRLTSRKLLRDKLQDMENHHVAATAPTLERSKSLARRHTLYSRKQRVAAELADAGCV